MSQTSHNQCSLSNIGKSLKSCDLQLCKSLQTEYVSLNYRHAHTQDINYHSLGTIFLDHHSPSIIKPTCYSLLHCYCLQAIVFTAALVTPTHLPTHTMHTEHLENACVQTVVPQERTQNRSSDVHTEPSLSTSRQKRRVMRKWCTEY